MGLYSVDVTNGILCNESNWTNGYRPQTIVSPCDFRADCAQALSSYTNIPNSPPSLFQALSSYTNIPSSPPFLPQASSSYTNIPMGYFCDAALNRLRSFMRR